MQNPQGIVPFLLQLLVLAVGIVLIATHKYWSDHVLAIASGIFFINIFWVTMVLAHDVKIWSFIRNSVIGNIFMIGLIVLNLLFIAVKAFLKLF